MDQSAEKDKDVTKKDDKMNEKEKKKAVENSGYYINRPKFGNNGPSKLKQQFSQGLTLLLVVIVCLLIYFALLRLKMISNVIHLILGILKPIIYGFAIAYLLNPIVKKVDEHLIPYINKHFPNSKKAAQISRGTGIFIAVILLISIITALCNMMLPELYKSIWNMVSTVPSQLNTAVDQITKMMSKDTTTGQLFTNVLMQATDFIQNWMKTDLLEQVNVVMSNLTVGVINVVKELFNGIIGIIISVYVLWGKEVFSQQAKKIVYAIFKPNSANMILHLTIKSNEIFGGFIIGKIIDSVIIGILCFIGLSILKMPYTLLVSVIVGVTNVIPFFGPYIGAIPSAILITLSNPIKGLYFLIFILILQQIDGNIIGPKIIGNSTGLSAFWVVFSILLGGGLFGIPGMILGVPTFAVLSYIVTMLINHNLEKKNLPTESSCYDELSYVDTDGTYVHSDRNEFKK